MNRKGLGSNLLKLIFFIACGYGIVKISIWSFYQTQAFFSPYDTDGTKVISTSLSLIAQYGQNVALFLAAIEAGRVLAYKNKIATLSNQVHVKILKDEIRKSENLITFYWFLFVVFSVIDGGTNLGQFYTTTYKTAMGAYDGWTLKIFWIVGTLISIAVVIFEEFFMATVNAVFHALNDVLENIGFRRFPSLDMFIDPDVILATRLSASEGNKAQNNGNQNNQSRQNQNNGNRQRQQQQQRQQNNSNMNNLPRANSGQQQTRTSDPAQGGKRVDQNNLAQKLKEYEARQQSKEIGNVPEIEEGEG